MFSAVFIDRPRFALVISLFTMIAGGLCAFTLPISEFPQVSPPTIMVIAAYPGASAQDIADAVAAPLESEINGVEHMIYYQSQSDNSGSYQLTMTFASDADPDMALVNVNNAVKRAERALPTEVTSNGVFTFKRSGDILGVVAISSSNPEHTPLFLSNYVSMNVKDAMARIRGVGQAIIFAAKDYSMRVWLDPLKMRALGVGYAEVAAAVQRQNVQAAAGSVGANFASDFMQFKIDARGRLRTPEEFGAVVLRSGADGRQVRLADVARVELGSEDYQGEATLNGQPTVPLAIFMQSDANALQVVNDVNAEIARLSKNFPDGMEWTFAYDSTVFVRVTMREIVQTLVLTFLLVVLITYVFLQDWRATLVPTVTIPVSLVGTFLFLSLFGMTINTLTMFALILVIGSVVDDAIVVVESCAHIIETERLAPRDAALKTMKLVTNALVSTTLVVLAVYAPIAFFGGMVGAIYKQFAVTMCIALCISTVNALTLSPALCAIVLRPVVKIPAPFRAFNYGLDKVRSLYLGVARLLVRALPLAALLFLGVLYGNAGLFRSLPSSFVPSEDKGVLFCEVVLPAGATFSRTEAAIAEVSAIARENPAVDRVLSVAGRSMTSGNGENVGMAILRLKDWDERAAPEMQLSRVHAMFSAQFASLPDAAVTVFAPPAITGLGTTGGVSFALQAVSDQSIPELSQAVGGLLAKVMASDKALYAFTSFDANTPMLDLELDRAKAEALGVPVSSVFNTLQTQLGSYYINDFNMFGKTYKVKMQSEPDFRRNLNAIGGLHVPSNSGAQVPIDALATVNWTLGPRQVERFNMFPSANINIQAKPGVSSGEVMEMAQNIVRDDLPPGYQIGWTGMSYQERQNEGRIIWLVLLSLVFSYLFLVAQYESWTMPVSVILSVATATLGGLLALKWTGHSLDIYCQLGLLMLVGLTAKTAILMVEFSKQERDENGLPVDVAALNGLKIRFRAVMMTALSYVIGVMPMVWASGAGAGSRRAIGITTFYGMIAATVAGMMFIPSLYVMFQRAGEWTMAFFGRVFGGAGPVAAGASASARRIPEDAGPTPENADSPASRSSRRFRGGIPGVDPED